MADVVGLDGQAVESELPALDTPIAVLFNLLHEIETGTVKPLRIIVSVEDDANPRFFTRSSQMTNAEAVSLLTVSKHILLTNLVG